MSALQSLALALGASFASGLNVYATVAALGLLHRSGIVKLPPSLEVLANPWVVGIALALYLVEFVADKIPYVDSAWDVVHTFIRPPAAGLLAYSAVGTVSEEWRLAAALLAGSVALTSHATKASMRVAVNTSPEPVSNWILSLGEDGLAIFLAWMAAAHPWITFAVVFLLISVSLYVVVKLFGALRRGLSRIFRRQPAPLPPQIL